LPHDLASPAFRLFNSPPPHGSLPRTPALAAIKKVPYPEVTVEVAAAQLPEASFGPFWKAFSDAVKSRNADRAVRAGRARLRVDLASGR